MQTLSYRARAPVEVCLFLGLPSTSIPIGNAKLARCTSVLTTSLSVAVPPRNAFTFYVHSVIATITCKHILGHEFEELVLEGASPLEERPEFTDHLIIHVASNTHMYVCMYVCRCNNANLLTEARTAFPKPYSKQTPKALN